MRFLFYVRLSSYMLIGTGFLSLLATEDYGILSAIIFTLLIFGGWRTDTGKLRLRFAPWMWNLATVAVLGICIVDAMFWRRLTSVALVDFLVFLQAVKLLNPKRNRDYMTLFLISFFQLLISSIMTFSIFFAVCCVLFAITGTWALITLHLKREVEAYILFNTAPPSEEPELEESYFNLPALTALLNPRFFASTFGIAMFAFMISPIIFIILPRIREGMFFTIANPLTQRVSGFSEEVDLGTFGAIREDYTPVMQVALPAISEETQLPIRLYWKGRTYNVYDGKRWKADGRRKSLVASRSYFENISWLIRPKNTKNLLEQQIDLLSRTYEVIFGANRIYGVKGRFLSLQYDRFTEKTEVVLNPYNPKYTVYSDISLPSETDLQNDYMTYPPSIQQFYLQLPELAGRVKTLATEIVKGRENPYDKAVAVQQYLTTNYTYSLDVQRPPDLPPLEDFLFVNKAGHCEFYATGMAILLRVVGVPTRLVNGYAQGRWNEYGKFFTVSQNDAHAWVEVYFPTHGWLMFDPTPPVAFSDAYQQFTERESVLARIYRYSEYIRTRWNRYVLDYNRTDQEQLVVGAFQATHSARHNIAYYVKRIQYYIQQAITHITEIRWQRVLGIIGLCAAGGGLLRFFLRTVLHIHIPLPRFKKRRKTTQEAMLRFYKTMLHILAKQGMIKESSATPREFARYVAQESAVYRQEVFDITNVYYAVRYGYAELPETELTRIEALLKQLKQKKMS